MSDDITITATDSDGTVLDTTTLALDTDALDSVSAQSPDSGRRGFLGGILAGVGSLALVGPTSAQQASRTLSIDGSGHDGSADYSFSVSGELTALTANEYDTMNASSASGSVWGGSDDFRFGGEITEFELLGPATVSVDGEQVAPETLGEDTESGDPSDGGTAPGNNASPNEVFASEFPGDGLASKVRNAHEWLLENTDGQGRIRVTPTDDGSEWIWDDELTFNFAGQDVGLQLDIDDDVPIVYEGGGTALTLVASDSSGINVSSRSKIIGGRWDATGDPDAWLQVDDAFRTRINPSEVSDFDIGVLLRNVEKWTESSHISGSYRDVRVGIEFRSNTEVGQGGGTDSFHDTSIENVQISARDYCLALSGRFMYSHVDNATLQPTESDSACIIFRTTRTDGTVFTATKFESPSNQGNTAAYEYGRNFDAFYGPMFINPEIGYGIDTETVGSGSEIPTIRSYGNKLWFEGLAGQGTPLQWDIADGMLRFGDGETGIRLDGGGLVAVDADGNETSLT